MYVDKALYSGRPEERRSPEEQRCYELLDGLNVEYMRVDHDRADTIEACHEIEKVLDCPICKNLFLCNRQQTAFYLLLMPGDKPFRTSVLSKQIGSSRLSFADGEHMRRYLAVAPGSVSVLGLMNDGEGKVSLLMDRELLDNETIGCHPCRNSSTIGITTADLLNKVLPAVHHDPVFVELPSVLA